MNDAVQEAIEHNARVLADQGPGLSYRYDSYVIARRPATNEILLGGLGAMGVGQMWTVEMPWHKEYPGYSEAEVRTA